VLTKRAIKRNDVRDRRVGQKGYNDDHPNDDDDNNNNG